MIYLIFVMAVLFGFTRGIKEGMVMIQPTDVMHKSMLHGSNFGIRAHKWYVCYHRISILAFAFFALGCGMLLRMPLDIGFTFVVLLVIWETFELGYAVARCGFPLGDSENLIIFTVWDKWVPVIHNIRCSLIIILLIVR